MRKGGGRAKRHVNIFRAISRIPPYLVEALWWIHHCVKQVAKKFKSVSQQAEVTWNVRTEWSEINDGSLIFEPWIHNKGRQNDRNHRAERKELYRKRDAEHDYWKTYLDTRTRRVLRERKRQKEAMKTEGDNAKTGDAAEQGAAKEKAKEKEGGGEEADSDDDELIQVGPKGEKAADEVHPEMIRRWLERDLKLKKEQRRRRREELGFPEEDAKPKVPEKDKPPAIQDEEKLFLWRNVPKGVVPPKFKLWSDHVEGEKAGKESGGKVPQRPATLDKDAGFFEDWKPPPRSWKYEAKGEAMAKSQGDCDCWDSFYNNQ